MEKLGNTFDEFVEVVRTLREKCPWDSSQTHESLKKCFMDEAKEAMEGIDILTKEGDGENLCEELGDVLFNVILQGIIAEEEGYFTLNDVLEGASAKMKYRHPKIFSPKDQAAAALSWEELKEKESRKSGISD